MIKWRWFKHRYINSDWSRNNLYINCLINCQIKKLLFSLFINQLGVLLSYDLVNHSTDGGITKIKGITQTLFDWFAVTLFFFFFFFLLQWVQSMSSKSTFNTTELPDSVTVWFKPTSFYHCMPENVVEDLTDRRWQCLKLRFRFKKPPFTCSCFVRHFSWRTCNHLVSLTYFSDNKLKKQTKNKTKKKICFGFLFLF